MGRSMGEDQIGEPMLRPIGETHKGDKRMRPTGRPKGRPVGETKWETNVGDQRGPMGYQRENNWGNQRQVNRENKRGTIGKTKGDTSRVNKGGDQ